MTSSYLKNISLKNQISHFGWYLIGTLVPILFNLIRNPIFTRIFSTDEYGYHSLVFITFNYISLALFSWLASNIWRFYYEYVKKDKLSFFFSNIFLIYAIGSALFILTAFYWYSSTENTLLRKIIIFSSLYYLVNDFINIYLVVVRLDEKVLEYNLIQSIRSAINFSTLCLFTFVFKFRIEAISLGFALSSSIILFYIIYRVLTRYRFLIFKFNCISKTLCKKLLHFGSVGLIANFSLLILNNSDRYFIALFHGIDFVGIYNQNYTIAQTALIAITTAFFNTINPELNRRLTESISLSNAFIVKNMLNYFLLLAPIVFIISIFAFDFNLILLGKDFRSGYSIIPYIVLTYFIYGIATFFETKLKFANKLRVVIISFIFTCLINVILNYFLLQQYSYTWAAKTTLIAYCFLLVLLAANDISLMRFFLRTYWKIIVFIVTLLLGMYGLSITIHYYLSIHSNLALNIFEGILMGAIYIGSLALLKGKIKRMHQTSDKFNGSLF